MDRVKHYDISSLPPFPEGWYFVGSRRAILKEKLTQKTWMGEKIVVWCDDKQRICVAKSACPHLGSELGPGRRGQDSRQLPCLSVPRLRIRRDRQVRRHALCSSAESHPAQCVRDAND